MSDKVGYLYVCHPHESFFSSRKLYGVTATPAACEMQMMPPVLPHTAPVDEEQPPLLDLLLDT